MDDSSNRSPEIQQRLATALKEKGHKVTPQRLAVWRVLASGGHHTAEDIHKRVMNELNFTGDSTVYRTVDLLRELGLVRPLLIKADRVYYERIPGQETKYTHPHFLCTACNKVFDLESITSFKELEDSSLDVGTADWSEMAVFGRCAPCNGVEDDQERAPSNESLINFLGAPQ